MYEKHFGFSERPFSLLPDPAFLYPSRKHTMAFATLEYGLLNHAPVILITGEIGSGKTTLIRQLLNSVSEEMAIGLIASTNRASGNFIEHVCMSFGLEFEGREQVALFKSFTDFLVEQYRSGRRTILIVDEAQNLRIDILEELRMLSNINADKDFVLQLVLVGQPELRRTLRLPTLEQFAQRIAVDYHLCSLDERETRDYVQHRLSVAAGSRQIFTRDALRRVHEYAAGVPRLINALCDSALVYAYAEGRQRVSARLVDDMVQERRSNGLFGAGKLDYEVAAEWPPESVSAP